MSAFPSRSIVRRMIGATLVVLTLLFMAANVGAYIYGRGHTLPHTTVGGKDIGRVPLQGVSESLRTSGVVPESVVLKVGDAEVRKSPRELGVVVDTDRMIRALQQQTSWLPVLDLVRNAASPLYVTYNGTVLHAILEGDLGETFAQDPVDGAIVIEDGVFTVRDDVPGRRLNVPAAIQTLVTGIEQGQKSITLPVDTAAAAVRRSDLEPTYLGLLGQSELPVKVVYKDQFVTYKAQDVVSWFKQTNEKWALDETKIAASLVQTGKTWGISPANATTLAKDVRRNLEAKNGATVTLVAQAVRKTFSYCTQLRGVEQDSLAGLKSKAAAVLGDARGWGLRGDVVFSEVATGCQFTLWLSAGASMTTFGSGCDTFWSCRSGNNVIINVDRWLHASEPWNARGGSLDDYRTMAINHEVGHWLGFGHATCLGSGQAAPVMMQQSVNLGGCVFNPWPTAGELLSLKSMLKL
jgi:hypothetical protein